MRNRNKNNLHPAARVFEDTTPIFTDRVINDNTAKHRIEVENMNKSADDMLAKDSYALKLKAVPQIFHEQKDEKNTPAALLQPENQLNDTEPYYMQTWPKNSTDRMVNDNTAKHHREVAIARAVDNTSQPGKLSNPREFEDTSQIFHTLPPTDEEFWGERKEAPRTLRVVRGIGYSALEAVQMTAATIYSTAAFVPATLMMATKTGEKMWQGIDVATSKLGVPSENPLRQHAANYIAAAPQNAEWLQSHTKSILDDAFDMATKPAPNQEWKTKLRRDLVDSYLKKAREAYEVHDQKEMRENLERARFHQY